MFTLIFYIAIFASFYFLVIRPLQRKYGADKEYTPYKPETHMTDFTTQSYPDSLISGVADTTTCGEDK